MARKVLVSIQLLLMIVFIIAIIYSKNNPAVKTAGFSIFVIFAILFILTGLANLILLFLKK